MSVLSVKWPLRFLGIAKQIASWSKDTTKVGAVATESQSRAVLETGFNGIPRGVEDRPERLARPEKYLWIGHAEENLVAHAARRTLNGATVTITHLCCSRCARLMINAGISRIECGSGQTSMPQREFEVAQEMLCEAGVQVVMLEDPVAD